MVSSYVLMKLLESTPERYDRGIRLLSRGRIDEVYRAVAEAACAPGARALDLGCGTGNLALACAARGARVTAIDIDAGMLEVARRKPVPEGAGGSVDWIQLGGAEIEDRFAPESFDAAVSCLCLSEMSPEERAYSLRALLGRLRPGGRLALADEVSPLGAAARLLKRVRRLPLEALTWLLTQTSTRALDDPAGLVTAAGFVDVAERRFDAIDMALVTARRAGA